MKILYDITILGRNYSDPYRRTGIYRVTENVAEELLHHPECDITFCANESWKDVVKANAYLETQGKLGNVHFSKPVNYERRNNLKNRMTALVEKHGGTWKHLPFLQKTTVRLNNKHLEIRESILRPSNNLLIHPKDLKTADIYHSHFIPSFKGLKEAGVKGIFYTSYDLIPILYPQFCDKGMPEFMQSVLNKLTTETWIVCISEATRNDLLNYMGNRLDPNKVSVTELAASNIFYQSTDKQANQLIRNSYGIPDAPYVLSLCTLEPRKNIDQAIRAFVQLVQEQNIPDLNLVLVGAKGWKSEKIFETVEASQAIKDRIYITGFMADEHLAAMYSDALMFVYPSFYEGFGLPPLEAMQCGVPVITSNTSSLPEVVGNAGIMVPPTDLDALCAAMLSVYQNPQLRHSMVQQSLGRAKLFSWKRCAEKTVAAYKTALQS